MGLLFIHLIIIISGYSHLPATIPIHYNLSGVADGYGSKENTIIELIISVIIFIVLSFLIQSKFIYKNYKGNPEHFGKVDPVVRAATQRVFSILRIAVVCVFLTIGIITFF